MFNKLIVVLFISTGLLLGCQSNQGELTSDAHKKMEEALGMDIMIPMYQGYEIKYAHIEYPPMINNKPVGNRHVVHIVYTNERGKLLEITQEEKEMVEKGNGRKILYGEYEGKPVISLNISNFKSSLANAEVKETKGIKVEYHFKDINTDDKVGFFIFNTQHGSYELTIHLTKDMTEEDAFMLVESTIDQITR